MTRKLPLLSNSGYSSHVHTSFPATLVKESLNISSSNLEYNLHLSYASIVYLLLSKKDLIFPKTICPFELQFSKVKIRAGPRQLHPSSNTPSQPPPTSLCVPHVHMHTYVHIYIYIFFFFSFSSPQCKYVTSLGNSVCHI